METITYTHLIDTVETETETEQDWAAAVAAGRDTLASTGEWSDCDISEMDEQSLAQLGAAALDGATDFYSVWCSYHA